MINNINPFSLDKLDLDPETETEFWNAYKSYEDSLYKLRKNNKDNLRKNLRNISPNLYKINNYMLFRAILANLRKIFGEKTRFEPIMNIILQKSEKFTDILHNFAKI